MASTLLALACERIQDLAMANLSGLRTAPNQPPEQMSEFPFIITFPATGSFQGQGAGTEQGLHGIVTEIHIDRDRGLAQAYRDLVDYGENFANVFQDPDNLPIVLPDAASTEVTYGPITYTFGPGNWAGIDTLRWRFTFTDLKIRSQL